MAPISWTSTPPLRARDPAAGAGAERGDQVKAELVVLNGTIYTMNPDQPTAEALAIAGGRIVAVGDAASVHTCVGPQTQTLDLRQAIAIPGLTDSHLHFVSFGLSLERVNLAGAASPSEVASRVGPRAQALPPGAWVRGRGWDRNLWTPPDLPTRQVLDAVASEHPVALVSKDGHALWVNSAALRELGIDSATADPPGGRILRDERTGQPTGILLEEAAGMALDRIETPSPQELRRAAMAATAEAHRRGLTSVHDCEGPEALAALLDLRREGTLALRVYMLIPRDNLDAAIRLGVQTGLGDEWLRLGHLKLFADGALGSRTADMLEPYEGEPENRGVEVLDSDALQAIVERASQAGIAPAVHAIGDRANRRVLDVYAQTRPLWASRGLRPRIEHAQLLTPFDLPRLGELGVIASMQPIHATSDMDMATAYWGARSAGGYAWHSLLQAGTVLAFGSDCPVESLDPLAGIYAAVTRQRPDGSPPGGWQPQERITAYQAVRAYTWGAAYASGEEGIKGSLEPGKLGDLVVLSDDVFRASPETLRQTEVVATVCGGRIVYSAMG